MLKGTGQMVADAQETAGDSNVTAELPGAQREQGSFFAEFRARPSVLGSLSSVSGGNSTRTSRAGNFVRANSEASDHQKHIDDEQQMRGIEDEYEEDERSQDRDMFEEALDQADKELQAEEERKAGQEKARAAMRARTTVKEKYGELEVEGPADAHPSIVENILETAEQPMSPADFSVMERLLSEGEQSLLADGGTSKLMRSGSRPMRRSMDMGATPTNLSSVRFKDLGKVMKSDVGKDGSVSSSPDTPSTPSSGKDTPTAADAEKLEREKLEHERKKVSMNANVSKALARMQTMQTSPESIGPSKVAMTSRRKDQNMNDDMKVSRTVKSWRGDGFWVCNPKNPKKVVWDMFSGALIVYSVTKIPFEMAFAPSEMDTTAMAICDLLVDFCFFVDMYLTFHTAYFESGTNLLRSKKKEIRKNYMRSWFVPDLVSALPLSNKLIVGDSESTDSLGIIKFIRLLRLVKLVRLVKLMRKGDSQEKEDTASSALLKLLALFGKITFLAHVISCFWFTVSDCKSQSYHGDNPSHFRQTWPYESWTFCGGEEDGSKYIASMYWSIATMMAVGYGDIVPRSSEAMVFAIVVQLIGAICFGFIIGAVSDSIEASNREKKMRHAKMNEIRDWTRSRGLTKKFRTEIIKHFEYSFARVTISDEADILSHLPHQLRLRVVLAGSMHRGIADGIEKSIRGLKDDSFLGEIVTRLKPCKLYPMDYILETGDVVEQLYFIKTGKVKLSVLDDFVHHVMIGIFSAGTSMCLYEVLHKKLAMCSMLAVSTVEMWSLEAADFLSLLRGRNTAVKHFERTAVAQHSAFCYSLETPTIKMGEATREQGLKIKETIVVDGEIVRHDVAMSKMNDATHSMIMKSCTLQQEQTESDSKAPPTPQNKRGSFNSESGEGAPKNLASRASAIIGNSGRMITNSGRIRSGSALISSLVTSTGLRSVESSSSMVGDSGPKHPILTLRLVKTEAITQHDHEEATITPYSDTTSLVEGYEASANLWLRGVINPMSSYKVAWDLFVGLAILSSVVQTPIMLGFKEELLLIPDVLERLTTVDFIVMCLFFADMVLVFVTAFENNAGVVVTPPALIRNNYFKLWFWIDMASTVPWDQIGGGEDEELADDSAENDFFGNSTMTSSSSGGGSDAQILRLLRILRLFRLLKLVRLLKFAKLLGNLQKYIQDVDPIVIKFVTLCMTLLVVAHVFGCFWNSVSNMKDDYLQDEYSVENLGEQYLACIYWAITTMTTVGYGDIIPGKECANENYKTCVTDKSVYEKNDAARIYASVIMLIGATIFGYIVGSASATVTDNSSSSAKEKLFLNQMLYYMDEQGVVSTLRSSIRSTMRFVLRKEGALFNEQAFYLGMPACLRNRVVTTFRATDIEKMPILAPLPISFLGVIVQRMHATHTSAGSMVFMPFEGSNAIHFTLNGCLVQVMRTKQPVSDALEHVYAFDEIPGSWLQPGDIFGQEELLGENHIGVRASTLCSCYSLLFKDITLLARMYPDLTQKLINILSKRIVEQKSDFDMRLWSINQKKAQGDAARKMSSMALSTQKTEPVVPGEGGTQGGFFQRIWGKADAAAKAFGFELEYRKFLYTPLERPGGDGAAVAGLDGTPNSTPKNGASVIFNIPGAGVGEEKRQEGDETVSEGASPSPMERGLSVSGRDSTWPQQEDRVNAVSEGEEGKSPTRRASAPYKLPSPPKTAKAFVNPFGNYRRRVVVTRGSSLGLGAAKKSVFQRMSEKQLEENAIEVERTLLEKFRALPKRDMKTIKDAQMMLSPKASKGSPDPSHRGVHTPMMLSNTRKSFSANSAIQSVSDNSSSVTSSSLARRRSSFHGVSEVSGRPLYFDDGAGTPTPRSKGSVKATGGGSFFNTPGPEPRKAPARVPSLRAIDIVGDFDLDEDGDAMAPLDISSAGVDVLEPPDRARGKGKSMAEVMVDTAKKGIGDDEARQSIIASSGQRSQASRTQDRVDRTTL
mmetsp:Transcript_45243/g.124480  ORF Transcript_45243/g.124480 Transcript_45243/m.124480 type:complete len:1964 (+) Transcript_45243:17-5908(+)|eukprot:CAMPEP_0119480854 /NCGR_PEP_ID=MMETSP1344-20130328/9472_1 /TAXON_ID=236787 /ORGANISM="Florenciella parvula, Strain CCMP2471" /LENGTH=1963 /DNA_ID=CAMNT_0007515203 /DNA_START=386 /DNA_END=6277 /DNA_ORIENTATION=+